MTASGLMQQNVWTRSLLIRSSLLQWTIGVHELYGVLPVSSSASPLKQSESKLTGHVHMARIKACMLIDSDALHACQSYLDFHENSM